MSTSCLFIVVIIAWPGILQAIDFSNGAWRTTFDYSQACKQHGYGGAIDCDTVKNDGLIWSSGTPNYPQGGENTEATAAANNSHGDGGMGARFWVNDGTNNQTGNITFVFTEPEPEIWLRWYQRYEADFKWAAGNPHYDKVIYMYTGADGYGGTQFQPGPAGNGRYSLYAQGISNGYVAVSEPAVTWTDVFGSASDGLFHMFELHIKMDTNGTDGVGQMWIDGRLVVDVSGVNFTDGDADARLGFKQLNFNSNQDSVDNGGVMYIDFDDMEIWNTTPPNRDAEGNPWIGPLNDFLGAGAYKPKPPSTLEVN